MKKLTSIKTLALVLVTGCTQLSFAQENQMIMHDAEAHQSSESAQVDVLARTEHAWDGSKYKAYPKGNPELSVLKFTLKPNLVLPWHHHPYPNAGYVLSGTLTIQDKQGHSKTYKQGEGFAESVNHVHRGVTGQDGAVLILVYSGVHGVPPSVSERGEKPEF